jgi:hypothetical protein
MVRPAPISKSFWKGDNTASIWFRLHLNNSHQNQKIPFHKLSLKPFIPQPTLVLNIVLQYPSVSKSFLLQGK